MEQKSSIGSIMGTIIIIAIIILGGLYFWGKRVEEAKLRQDLVGNTGGSESQVQQNDQNIGSTSSSDDVNAIEADLKATSFDNMDTELNSTAQ